MELYRNGLKLTATIGLDESRGSVNVTVRLLHNENDEYLNYTEQIHIRYLFDNQVKEEILPTNDNGFYIPGKPLSYDGPIELAVHLINGDIELVTNELSFVVKNAPNGTTQVDPSEFTWQQLVDQYVNAKLDTFANKLDLSKFEEKVNGSIENQNQNIESFKTDVNANLSNQDKKITDFQNKTKVSLDSQNTKIDNFKSEVNTSLSNQNTSINQTTSAQNSKITTLEGRMDTFTSLSEGSTTGDAELKDIRVGANGVTYNNAGDAVRGQYSQLKEDLDKQINLINKSYPKKYQKISTINDKYIWYNGVAYENENYAYDIFEINNFSSCKININGTGSEGFASYVIYDKNDKILKGDTIFYQGVDHSKNIDVPVTAYKIAISRLKTNTTNIEYVDGSDIKIYTTDLIPDCGLFASFLKVGCIGDSLSSGESYPSATSGSGIDFYEHSWPQYMSRATSNKYYNFSKGGLTTKSWLNDEVATECFKIENKCAGYIIALGVNDMNQNINIGSISDINIDDYNQNNDSFYGNYGKIIQKLNEFQNGVKIFIMTAPSDNMETKGYNEAIRNIANLFDNVYIVDLYSRCYYLYNLGFIKNTEFYGHYRAITYNYMSKIIGTILNKIMMENYSDFTKIEFIGTDNA